MKQEDLDRFLQTMQPVESRVVRLKIIRPEKPKAPKQVAEPKPKPIPEPKPANKTGRTNAPHTRRPMSEERRAKLSAATKGITRSPETRDKIRQARTGRKHNEESKLKIAETKKSRQQEKHESLSCPHCCKEAYWPKKFYRFSQAKEMMEAYHWDNCPLR